MTKSSRLFIVILHLTCIIGCKEYDKKKSLTLNVGNYDLVSVYEQKIRNSDSAIYDFGLVGNITGSTFSGITILDTLDNLSKENFNERLPFTYLQKIPTEDTIWGLELVKAKDNFNIDLKPKEIETKKKGGINYKIEYREKYNGYSTLDCFLESYSFDEIIESTDSITIKGITNKFVNSDRKFSNTMKFRKGNIKLVDKGNGLLEKIIIRKLIQGIGDERIFNKKSPSYGNEQKNIKVVCIKTYNFEPQKNIKIDTFSDYGFYKKAK